MFDFVLDVDQSWLSNKRPVRNSFDFVLNLNETPFSECIDAVNTAVLKMKTIHDRHMVSLKINVELKNDTHIYEITQCFTGTGLGTFLGEENTKQILHELTRIFVRKLIDYAVSIEIDVTSHGVTCKLTGSGV